jgi:hypothetical protein
VNVESLKATSLFHPGRWSKLANTTTITNGTTTTGESQSDVKLKEGQVEVSEEVSQHNNATEINKKVSKKG